MRKFHLSLFGLLFICLVASGCAVNLPFNNRLAYPIVQEAKDMSAIKKGPVSVKWISPAFPERIDVQGSSGFVGGGSRTRIPTGVGLANRIIEVLDVIVGVNKSSDKLLTITVIEAKSEFEYSAGFFNVTPAIDVGRCVFEAEFILGNKQWKQKFTAEEKDPTIGGTSQTGVLEKVWDNIALQVGRSVRQHM